MKIPQTPIHFFYMAPRKRTGLNHISTFASSTWYSIFQSNTYISQCISQISSLFYYEQTFDVFPSPRSHNSHPLQTCSIHDTWSKWGRSGPYGTLKHLPAIHSPLFPSGRHLAWTCPLHTVFLRYGMYSIRDNPSIDVLQYNLASGLHIVRKGRS